MSEKLESSREELTALRVKQMKDQTLLEFSRYKQDCRKRALDLASQENSSSMLRAASTLNQGLSGGNLDIVFLADKYYNWLISIPNE